MQSVEPLRASGVWVGHEEFLKMGQGPRHGPPAEAASDPADCLGLGGRPCVEAGGSRKPLRMRVLPYSGSAEAKAARQPMSAAVETGRGAQWNRSTHGGATRTAVDGEVGPTAHSPGTSWIVALRRVLSADAAPRNRNNTSSRNHEAQ